MNDDPNVGSDLLRFREACEWFVQLREQPESTNLIAGWLSWCNCDPRNRQAFEEARNTWLIVGLMPAHTCVDARAEGGQVDSEAHRAPLRRPARTLPTPQLAAAAAAGLAIAAGFFWLLVPGPFSTAESADVSTFATAPSEHRSFMLADGSRVEMAGNSRLRVSLRAHTRDIELQEGEAYFNVAHDKARPFTVHAGALHVRAVGTRFDVRTTADRVVVAVEEGVVVVEPRPEPAGPISSMLSTIRSLNGEARPISQMRPLHVRGGQEIAVGGPEHDLQLLPIEPTQVSSWREGRLRFAREPLQSVISSIRGVSGQEIELADPGLGELRFTGTVFSSGVETWVHALPAIFPVTVHQDGARFIIARRVEPRD
jgi:transmembrane sensor